MIDIRYIGPNGEYEDSLYNTGIWRHGEVKPVDRETASFMLVHPDVYEDARPSKARKKDPVTPQQRPQRYRHHEIDLQPAAANLPAMNKEALADYAMRQLGTHINPTEMTRDQVLDRVRGLMRERA